MAGPVSATASSSDGLDRSVTCWPGPDGESFFVGSVSCQPGTAHPSLPSKWLVSLRATSLRPEVDAWIVVIEQFATSMCR